MFQLADGRQNVYQWDINVKLLLDEGNKSADEVHFSARFSRVSLSVEVVRTEDSSYVTIPNILLQKPNDIIAYSYITNADGSYTKYDTIIPVIARPKPSGYIYEETETLTWKTLDDKIDDLRKNTADAVKYIPQELTDDQKAQARTNIGAVSVDEVPKQAQTDWDQKDDTAADYLKNRPFYLEKTLVVELTKDDFSVNDQDGYIKYMYRSTPKLDWLTSAESIAFEIEIIDTNGKRYTATQDSLDVYIEKDYTDDDYEYWSCWSSLVEIVSGIDLDFYDDEYYYKDEWGVLANYGGSELSEISIKIYRVDVKKIPKNCLDAAIGKTAITVGSELADSESEISPSVIIPDLRIPISPSDFDEDIYYDRIGNTLRISGSLFPYEGTLTYTFQKVIPTTAGSSISFDISHEGDILWDKIGYYSSWNNGHWLFFTLYSSYSGGGRINFLSCGNSRTTQFCEIAVSNIGHLYKITFKYTNTYKALNVTIKCIVE